MKVPENQTHMASPKLPFFLAHVNISQIHYFMAPARKGVEDRQRKLSINRRRVQALLLYNWATFTSYKIHMREGYQYENKGLHGNMKLLQKKRKRFSIFQIEKEAGEIPTNGWKVHIDIRVNNELSAAMNRCRVARIALKELYSLGPMMSIQVGFPMPSVPHCLCISLELRLGLCLYERKQWTKHGVGKL